MSVAIACNQCGRPVQTTGFRGLCARCLFACTTVRLTADEWVALTEELPPGEVLDYGLAVGPGGRFVLLDKLGEGGDGRGVAGQRPRVKPGG